MRNAGKLNNDCNALIAYGGFAPGGANHAALGSLPGRWRCGKILASRGAHPDDIGLGTSDVVEAWVLEFPSRDGEEHYGVVTE